MTDTFKLGRNGKFGNIDFEKLRSGITKKDLGIEGNTVLSNIFDSIDKAEDSENKGNGKLERNELIAFINKIRELAGKDTTISESEAKNYELNGEKLGKNKEDILTFISKLAELTKGVKNVSVSSNTEIITYEDGHTEQIFADSSKIITVKNGNKTTVTKKNADDKTTEEIVEEDGTTTKTEYEENSTNPKKQTITNQETETIILYSNGKKISQKVTNKQTGEIQEFGFDEQGSPVLKKTTKPGEETSYAGGVPSKKTTTTQTEEGTRVSNITYDGNNSTENVSIDGKIRYQKKVIDGVEYEVRYDENGNTLGVIVQNGESIQAIAKKFGVSPEDLVRANAGLLKGKRYFNVGDEIKIPRRMEADEYAKAQEGRLNKEGAVQQFNADAARRKAEVERREAERQAKIGDEIARGQNGYYVTKTSDGNLHYWNPNKKEISPEEFKKVCPSIYENVTQTQRGATKKTRNKYDIPIIKRQAGDLAKKIHTQIAPASLNKNTINLLRGITPENAAFVISEYQRMFNVSLAKDIDDEWGLDINTVKEHICKKLVDQAKSLGIQGIYYGDYQKINDLNSLQNWINKASSKIISTMSNAKETYYATEAEETQRQQSREMQRTAKEEASQIVNDLIKETSGINDVDKIKDIIRRIDKPEEMAEVNRLLTLKGYPPTDKYSAIENYIYQEANNSIVHTYNSSDYLEQTVQEWINNETLKGQAANEAQARMAARVLYDGGDGFGTDPEKIKKAVRMIKCPKPTGNREADNKQAREVYRLVNNMIKKHNTFYGLGSSCADLRDYCKYELWESEVKYLNGILAETNAIQGQEKAQAVLDLTQEAVEDAGTNIEYLEQAIRGIDSPEDRKAVEAKLKEYCQKKGIEPKIAGQSYLQAILYDECDTFMGISKDHKEIRKFNEMLIKQGAYGKEDSEEVVALRAEQAALQILEGNFSDIKDAVEQIKDKKVLAKLEQLLTTKGYKSLDDFLSQKLNSTKSDLINAELASNNLLPNKKAADIAYRLMKNSDFDNRAMGLRAIRNEVVAKMVDEKLKKDGSSLAKFMEQFNKEKAEYKTKSAIWDGLGKFIPVVGTFAEDISDAYRENTDISDNMFVEMQQALDLTPEQKAAYQMTVKLMEQKLAQMEKDYQAALDSQGAVSWAVNRFCENYGIGTTREEIQARIEHDRETIRLLKLAEAGKLGKMENGKTVAVSFESVFKERNVDTNFDTTKVEKVQKQAEMLGAMDYAKTNIAICWQEIDNGLNSTDAKRLTIAILDTLEKLSTMSGRELSLAGYGYKVKDSIIFDSADNPVPPEKLRELANQLKQGLADVAKDLLGQEIPLNTSSSKINEVLEDAYNNKKESFKQEFKDAFGQDSPDELIDSYISTINTGKMVVNFGAIIGAAIAAPFTGGGSLAVFAAVAGVSMGLNALEKSTDADGYTNMEWTSDAEQALWDGALAAAGMKVGQYAELFARGGIEAKAAQALIAKNRAVLSKMISNPQTLERATIWVARVEAAGFEVTSDTLQSLVQMYCQEGHFDEASFLRALFMSIGFNAAGHAWGARGDVKQGQKALDAPSREVLPPPSEAKPHETPQQPKQIGSDGQNPHHVDGDADAGKVGDAPKEEPKVKEEPKAKDEPEVKEDPEVKGEGANGTGRTQQQQPKTYAEMNENELFAEYQRLNNEVIYGELSNSEKVVNINKMKEISKKLDAKGYSIEAGELKSKSKSNHAKTEKELAQDLDATKKTKTKIQEELNDIAEANAPKKDSISKQIRIEHLGQTLANVFDIWVEKIQNINISNLVEIPLWVKNIKKQFKKFPEYGNELLGYLKKQVNSISDLSSDIKIDATKGISSAGSKLTKKLAKLQDKIIEAIDDLVDVKHFNKIAKSINKHFSDIEDVFNNLWDKLMAKARQLDLDLETNLIKKKVKTPYDNLQPQNTNYLKNIANKHHAKIVDVNINTAHFKRGDSFVIDLATNKNAQILLGPIMSIDLSEPRLAKLLLNLKEGQSFTIGSFEGHATYRMGSSANGVSHEHLIVTKKNGVYIFKDTSTYGTHVSKNSAEPIKSKEVKDMFWGNHTKGSYYMGKVHNGGISLDSEDYKNIAKLMNKCNGKYRKLWESTFLIDNGRNIDKLAAFENLIRRHGTLEYYLNMDDRTWAVVVENICQKHESAVNAIHNYKASSSSINQSLSAHKAFSQETASMINNMTDYLNTQTINKRIKVYRGEQYNGSLSLLKFPNGMSVGQAMENLIRKGASQQEINSFVNKYLIGSSFKQERFMSTALNRDFCADWAKSNAMGHSGPNSYGSVVWEIDVPGETKGAFVEDFNTFYGEEYEVILQRESSLIIKGAYYDKNKNQWIIQATVQQTPYENIPRY